MSFGMCISVLCNLLFVFCSLCFVCFYEQIGLDLWTVKMDQTLGSTHSLSFLSLPFSFSHLFLSLSYFLFLFFLSLYISDSADGYKKHYSIPHYHIPLTFQCPYGHTVVVILSTIHPTFSPSIVISVIVHCVHYHTPAMH